LAFATIHLPLGLDIADRKEATKVLGFGTSAKILSDPYPLGGYSGYEVGTFIQSLSVDDLAELGHTLASAQSDVQYMGLTVGKGIYNNIDIYLQWVPYTSGTELTTYGGLVRWCFYQASFLPLTLSATLHGSMAGFSNLVSTRTYGFDLVGGVNVKAVSLFAGIGPIYSTGRFNGGSALTSLTNTGNDETADVRALHSQIGLNVEYKKIFFAVEMDRYTQSVYSSQLGVRF
jgi:hypothetical protein